MSQTAKQVDYRGFHWDLRLPSNIDTEIAEGRDWEPVVTKWVEQYVKPGMTVLDVGANFGWFTLIMARLVGNSGHVVAVEPERRFLDRLYRHLDMNHIENVSAWPLALGEKACLRTSTLNAPPYYTSARISDKHAETEADSTVSCAMLDVLWTYDRLDFVQLDVDGYELKVLQGAEKTFTRFRPPLAIEIETLDVPQLLMSWGYTLYWERDNRKVAPADLADIFSPALPTLNILGVPP
jgi:FkbM family methyltransferase